jgi:PTS system mannose-specific IIA component
MHFSARTSSKIEGFHRGPRLIWFAAFKKTKTHMIGIVIVTHGRLAQEMISAMEHMVGQIAAAAKSVDMGNGVVLVTDMYGGTPCNLALTLLERGKIEVLAGANLPSLIKLVDVRTKLPLDAAVKEAIDAGRKYMRAGSADLAGVA